MNKAKKKISYPVIYEAAEEGGFITYVPALPGCHTQGDTFEESEQNINEAIELYLETSKINNLPIPLPRNIYQGRIEIAV